MIDLSDDNDPMLFAVTIPNGRLIVQYMEILAAVQARVGSDAQPDVANVVSAMREHSRTPEVAKAATDAVLVAAWHRMTAAVTKSGNG